MFGITQIEHDDRYAQAAEWIEIIERLWVEDEPFNFNGRFYTLHEAYSEPKPVQRPRPPIMNAGLSPAGRQFAAQYSDLIFIAAHDFEGLRSTAADVRQRAADLGREIAVWTTATLMVGETDADVNRRYNYFVHETGDWASAEAFVRSSLKGGTGLKEDPDSGHVREGGRRRRGPTPDWDTGAARRADGSLYGRGHQRVCRHLLRLRERHQDVRRSRGSIGGARRSPRSVPTFGLTRENGMRLGAIAAWANLDPMTPLQSAAAAARVEALGYSALWYPDSMTYDSLTRASTLLSATSTLVVATGITCIYNRPAWSTGAAQRVLFDQSDGRFLLGLGVSHEASVEQARHATYGPPLATMREYLAQLDVEVAARDDVLASLAAGDRPSLSGTRMPRVISALGPKMLELAHMNAMARIRTWSRPTTRGTLRALLGPERWLCVEQTVILQADPSRARTAARGALALYLAMPNYRASWRRLGFQDDDFAGGGSDRLVDATVAWGDENVIVRRISEHLDAGATQVCVQTLRSDNGPLGPEWSTLEFVGRRLSHAPKPE